MIYVKLFEHFVTEMSFKKAKTEEEAYQQGWDEYYENNHGNINPYPKNTKFAIAWDNGNKDAFDDEHETQNEQFITELFTHSEKEKIDELMKKLMSRIKDSKLANELKRFTLILEIDPYMNIRSYVDHIRHHFGNSIDMSGITVESLSEDELNESPVIKLNPEITDKRTKFDTAERIHLAVNSLYDMAKDAFEQRGKSIKSAELYSYNKYDGYQMRITDNEGTEMVINVNLGKVGMEDQRNGSIDIRYNMDKKVIGKRSKHFGDVEINVEEQRDEIIGALNDIIK